MAAEKRSAVATIKDHAASFSLGVAESAIVIAGGALGYGGNASLMGAVEGAGLSAGAGYIFDRVAKGRMKAKGRVFKNRSRKAGWALPPVIVGAAIALRIAFSGASAPQQPQQADVAGHVQAPVTPRAGL